MDEDGRTLRLEDVLKYAKESVGYYLSKHGRDLPAEHREDVAQCAYVRICDAWSRFDEAKGWKSFVQTHCKGAVLDFIRGGKGFEETKESLALPTAVEGDEGDDGETSESEQPEPVTFAPKLRFRVTVPMDDGERTADVEECAGMFGVFAGANSDETFHPNWPLVARMASIDEDIHLVAKLWLGFTQTELAAHFGVTRERLSQRVQEFLERLDSPEFYHSRWTRAVIHAFDLEEEFNIPEDERGDQGEARYLQPVNLFADTSVREMVGHQFGLFI